MVLGFRKFISEVFVNGKFPKILPSENFPLYGIPYIAILFYYPLISNVAPSLDDTIGAQRRQFESLEK